MSSPKPPRNAKNVSSMKSAAELHLELGTDLLITPQGSTERTPCKVIGLSVNEYIIARMPLIPGFTTKFPDGCMATIRYIFHGNVYGFKTALLGHSLKPAPMLYIEYPYSIEKVELRKHKRVQCTLVGRLHTPRAVHPMVTLDISQSGCRLAISPAGNDEDDMAKGETVMSEVLFRAAGSEFIAGSIKNIQWMESNLLLGLQFHFYDKPVEEMLNIFLERVGDIYDAA